MKHVSFLTGVIAEMVSPTPVQPKVVPVDPQKSGLEDAKRLMWGTYGKGGLTHCGGTCPAHQLRWVRVIDCSTEHLYAILATQPQINYSYSHYKDAIKAVLIDRGSLVV